MNEKDFMIHYNYSQKITQYIKKGTCKKCNSPIIVKVIAYIDVHQIIRQLFLEEISKDDLGKKHIHPNISSPLIASDEFFDDGVFNEYRVVDVLFRSYFSHELKIFDRGVLEGTNRDPHCSIYQFIYNHDINCEYNIIANSKYKGLSQCPYVIMEYLDFNQHHHFYNEEIDILVVLSKTGKSIKLLVREFTRKEINWLQELFSKKSIVNIQ